MKLSFKSAYKLKKLDNLCSWEIEEIYQNFNRLPESEKQKLANIVIANYKKMLKQQQRFDNSIDILKGYDELHAKRNIVLYGRNLYLGVGLAGFASIIAVCSLSALGIMPDDSPLIKLSIVPLIAISVCGIMGYCMCVAEHDNDVKYYRFDKHPIKTKKLKKINDNAYKVNKLLGLAEQVTGQKYDRLNKL